LGLIPGDHFHFAIAKKNSDKQDQHLKGKEIKYQLVVVMLAQDEKQDSTEKKKF
jgi:hypothetical protein